MLKALVDLNVYKTANRLSDADLLLIGDIDGSGHANQWRLERFNRAVADRGRINRQRAGAGITRAGSRRCSLTSPELELG